ncbi:helix-turn-helix transcriptional regulator [Streptomyces sp. NPDC005708]|uniref:helix-turn-helix transcriptional regulator n=1 Tax=Streptomyces sp. NPDC005708 TaxID=3154564 RepID=UPI0033D14A45
MDSVNKLGEFLRVRRARTTLAQAGLPDTGPRRTPGLRREEVAMLAGISKGYYARLEQGLEKYPSDQVLSALTRVFALDQDAEEHLHHLAQRTHRPWAEYCEEASPSLMRMLESYRDTPAMIYNSRLDILAGNALGKELLSEALEDGNLVRFTFLNPKAQKFYQDWDEIARIGVSHIRATASANPDDSPLTALVSELSQVSPEFRRLWEQYEIRSKTREIKLLHHPAVGDLTLIYQSFKIVDAPGQQLATYTAEPGSPSEERLAQLRSLVADRGAAT